MEQRTSPEQKKRFVTYGIIAIVCFLFFLLGWFLKGENDHTSTPLPLRLSGYQFISPLLACNFNNPKVFPEDNTLQNSLQSVIGEHVSRGDISKGSVYVGDFATGAWANVGQGQKYYPSSLGKIPIMMAYYLQAESSTDILDEQIEYPISAPDLNISQDIQPQQKILPGHSYSIEQLIKYMIEDSDNNAAELLYEHINPAALEDVYNDLQIPFEENVSLANSDFMTPQQVGILFRVLYNSTYLSHDYSEKALALMSRSSFTQGIVAGVPSSTVVAHKLGLVIITEDGITTEHELHDCGIVYATSNPYLLCIMTRGSSTLATMEGTIADIAKTAYQEITSNN